MIVNKYYKGGGSGSGVTPEQVQQQINSALTPYWESGETKDYVDEAISGISLEGYATSGDMQSAFALISETQQVAAAGLNQLEGRIDELSGASVDLSAYWTSAETQDAIDENTNTVFPRLPIFRIDWGAAPFQYINSALFDVDENEEPASSIWLMTETYDWVDNNVDWDTFSPSFTIDTENKVAYIENLPAGNYVFNLFKNPGVNYDVFEVWCWDGGDYNHYDCNSTEDAYNQPGQVINDYWKDKLADGVLIANGTGGGGIWSFHKDVARLEIRVVEENGEEVGQLNITYKPTIDEVVSAYTPTANFATVNGSAITNGGNIVIEGGADMSAYYTSAQTEDAISAATSGKADAVNTQGNNGGLKFPLWNTQGVITGLASNNTYHMAGFGVNGKNYNIIQYNYNGIPGIYAPLSAGNAGDILVSTGSGAPVWSAVSFPDVSNYVTSAQVETQITSKGYATVSQIPTSNTAFTNDAGYITSAATANMVTSTSVSTIWRGTQAEYDAIVDKDPNTFYIIVNN